MPLEGWDEVRRNLEKAHRDMLKRAGDAADEIAQMLETYAKTNAPFKDRTTNLRGSIDGTWVQVGRDVFRVVLSAGMEYAGFVELLHQGRYAYLWPAIMANEARIMEIWRKRLSVSGTTEEARAGASGSGPKHGAFRESQRRKAIAAGKEAFWTGYRWERTQ